MVISRHFPVFEYPDKAPPLKLDKKEKNDLAILNVEMATAARKKLEIIRGAARRQGIIADKLDDLKSESGQPFVEEKTKRSFFGQNFRIAVVRMDVSIAEKTLPVVEETAYLCKALYSCGGEKDSCGWVKGNPRHENYDDIGPLSGSAGVRYYCKICGKLIGEDRHTVS